MRKLAEFSVKNSLFVNLISVFVILAGLFSVVNMRREAFPNISFDVAQIMTTYRGSTADQVEKLITSPIEKEIRSVSGIDEISSTSYDGSSVISVKIDPDVEDKSEVINDLRRAVDRIRDLPTEIDKPVVYDIKMKEHPVIMASISGDVSEEALQQYADSLEDRFLDISGVSKIERRGYRDKQIWVEVDPQKLVDYYVSMEEVMDALRRHNVTIPGGKLRSSAAEYVIRTSAEFYTPEEIEEVVIRANDAGNILMVKDIAVVKNSFEDADIINKADGKKAITLIVVKKETADAITTVDQVKTVVKQAQKALPAELSISLSNDLSYFIKRRLNVLRSNGIFGFILVVILLFVFLTPMSATFTALGLPIAFLATFAMMSFFGITINLISMFGLIMVLGIVVDDSIIISENVYRYVEEGLSPKEAAIKGASQVMLPVLSTVLTTIAAFTPLLFMSGLIGKFIRVIPQVVIIALAASLLEAFIILPSHLADFLKPIKQTFIRKEEKLWFKWIQNMYGKFLAYALNLRYVFFAFTAVLFIGSIIFAAKFMPFVLFSGKGLEQFMIRAEAPLGTSLNKTNEMMREVEEIVETIKKNELDTYTTEIGQLQEERGYDPNAKKGSQYGQITIYLTAAQHRKRTAEEIANSLRPKLKELEKRSGFEKIFVSVMKEGPPTGKPVEIRVRGDEYATLNEIGEKVISELSQISGVYDIKTNYGYGKLELKVNIDEDMAKML
ncbi:MAG: efflux RND transporter permease subunit, partial [Candidatus Omnitrophota bacterium]